MTISEYLTSKLSPRELDKLTRELYLIRNRKTKKGKEVKK